MGKQVLLDLKIDLGAVEGCDKCFGNGSRYCSRRQVNQNTRFRLDLPLIMQFVAT